MRRLAQLLINVGLVAVLAAAPASLSRTPDDTPFEVDGAAAASQFSVACTLSHSAADDPIVKPGEPGGSHRHDFVGNTETDAFSTAATLRDGRTSCNKTADRSGYWTPALYLNGKRILPKFTNVYYQRGTWRDVTVKPPPAGLKIVAGNAKATAPQPTHVVAWTCSGSGGSGSATPPSCSGDSTLVVRVRFPSCWNGKNLDSANHMSHMAYPTDGWCPATHPVYVARLVINVHTPVKTASGLSFASGSINTFHGDFFNGWVQTELAKLVNSIQ